jgi:hypothetical protein
MIDLQTACNAMRQFHHHQADSCSSSGVRPRADSGFYAIGSMVTVIPLSSPPETIAIPVSMPWVDCLRDIGGSWRVEKRGKPKL